MAVDPAFRDLVLDRLSAVAPVRARAMFGGYGIYTGDLFFALIAGQRLYFKVGDLNRRDFEAAGMSPFFPYESPKPMHYWELPPGLLDDPDLLAPWVEKAVAVAEAARRPRSRRTKRDA